MKMLKQRKTSVMKNSLSVSFNETFDFLVDEENVQNTYFVLDLRDNSGFNKRGESHWTSLIRVNTDLCTINTETVSGSSLASVIIGPSHATKGSGVVQWEKCISHPREKIYQWHRMLETNNKISSSLSMLMVKWLRESQSPNFSIFIFNHHRVITPVLGFSSPFLSLFFSFSSTFSGDVPGNNSPGKTMSLLKRILTNPHNSRFVLPQRCLTIICCTSLK